MIAYLPEEYVIRASFDETNALIAGLRALQYILEIPEEKRSEREQSIIELMENEHGVIFMDASRIDNMIEELN